MTCINVQELYHALLVPLLNCSVLPDIYVTVASNVLYETAKQKEVHFSASQSRDLFSLTSSPKMSKATSALVNTSNEYIIVLCILYSLILQLFQMCQPCRQWLIHTKLVASMHSKFSFHLDLNSRFQIFTVRTQDCAWHTVVKTVHQSEM